MKREVDKYFEENKPHAGLGRTSLRSGVTFVAARGLNTFVQVASMVVLARLLSPHDFGLVAMAMALVGFAPMLIDLGTTDACTQKTQISHVEISALFWLNVSIGCLLTMLLVAVGGLLAFFFGEPSLTSILPALSLTFIMAAISTQHFALMRRAMQFRQLAIINIASNSIGAVVSITMAFADWGYWSLVAKPIVTSGLMALGVWSSCPWAPGRPRMTPDVKELVGFGMGVTGFTMTDYLARSADRLAIGFFYGAGPLGIFQNAFLIYDNLLNILVEPLHNIAVTSLSKLRNSVDDLKRSWTAALSSFSFFSASIFAILAVVAQDLVVLLLGPKWEAAGPLLCIFAIRGIAHSIERTLGWLHVAAGRSDRWMRWGVVSAGCQLAALAAGLPFGLVGVTTAYTIAWFSLFVPALAYAGRPFGIGFKDVLQAVGPQVAAALMTVAFAFVVQQRFLDDCSRLSRLLVSAPICLAVYLTVVVGVFKVAGPIRLAFSILRDFVPIASRRGL